MGKVHSNLAPSFEKDESMILVNPSSLNPCKIIRIYIAGKTQVKPWVISSVSISLNHNRLTINGTCTLIVFKTLTTHVSLVFRWGCSIIYIYSGVWSKEDIRYQRACPHPQDSLITSISRENNRLHIMEYTGKTRTSFRVHYHLFYFIHHFVYWLMIYPLSYLFLAYLVG